MNNAMENKKYKFIEDDFRRLDNENRKAYRIVALRNFADVKKGDLGGYVEKEENLSHEGLAWVYDDGVVFDNARVKDDATVHDRAVVCGNALIKNSAKVMDAARISESAVLCDSACAMNYSTVCGLSVMSDKSVAAGFSTIGKAVVCTDTVRVYERATVWGDIKITGDSHIHGKVNLTMSPITLCDADIFQQFHVVAFHGFGSRLSSTAVYNNRNGGLYVTCGCFNGTIGEFKRKVRETHGGNQFAKEYDALIKMVLKHNFKTWPRKK